MKTAKFCEKKHPKFRKTVYLLFKKKELIGKRKAGKRILLQIHLDGTTATVALTCT